MYEFLLRLEQFFVRELKTIVDKKSTEIKKPRRHYKPPPKKPIDILE